MKFSLQFLGDTYEDQEELAAIYHAQDLCFALSRAKEMIRTRLKHGENVSEDEQRTLEDIREALYVDGIS